MKHYDSGIVDQIIHSKNTFLMKQFIANTLRIPTKNDTHLSFMLGIIDKLIKSISEIHNEDLNEKERDNVKKALRILENYRAKKSAIEAKIK